MKLLEENPNELDIIFISSPDAKYAIMDSYKIPALAKEMCEILFYDVTYSIGHMDPPKLHHVQQALDFAKGRDKLIVACQAGVSRSSATAYIILASIYGPLEALKVLDPKVHMPNAMVIKHGSVILGDPDITDIIDKWKTKADEAQWDTGPSLM